MELRTGDFDEEDDHDYDLPEEPDEVTDAAIVEAYREAVENPATPESVERLRSRLDRLIDKFANGGEGNKFTFGTEQ